MTRNKIINGLLVIISFLSVSFLVFTLVADNSIYNDPVYKKLNEVKSILDESYYIDLDDEKLSDDAITGMVDGINDKYTHYYKPEEWEKLKEQLNGQYTGIGIVISHLKESGTVIESVFSSSPAESAGLLPGDEIIRVNDIDVSDKTPSETADLISAGDETVVLAIRRNGEKSERIYSVKKDKVSENHVTVKMPEAEIGYMRIAEFDVHVTDDFKSALVDLKAKGAKKLIIDLRDNPGGDLEQVTEMCDFLLPEANIVYIEYKDGRREYYDSDADYDNIPFVVLVNERSASASEIFAAAMKDNGRAEIIGVKTYGKGLVQRVQTLSDGSGLYFTVARYYTPKGVCIHGIGVDPDIKSEVAEKYVIDGETVNISAISEEEDIQLKRALEAIKLQENK